MRRFGDPWRQIFSLENFAAFMREEDGFLPIIGGIVSALGGAAAIGKAALGLGASYLGTKLGNRLDEKSAQNQYRFLEDQGLTPQEIVGGSMPQGGRAGGTLGNQYSQVVRDQVQMAYDNFQRDKDRAVAMRGQDAGIQAAQTSAGASIYSSRTQAQIAQARLALDERRFENAELPKALNDIATSTPEWKRQELLARMGVDNVIATTIAGSMGLDVMDPSVLAGMSEEDFKRLVATIYGLQSTVFRESAGGAIVLENTFESLGSSSSEPSPGSRGRPHRRRP